MDEKLKKKLFEWCGSEKERKLTEKAIARLESKNPFCFTREKTTHCKCIEENDLFGDIDKAIKLLVKMKEDGYTAFRQEWFGYEENGFKVEKIEDETDDEMLLRFSNMVSQMIRTIINEESAEMVKKAEIEKLERKLKQLKGEI